MKILGCGKIGDAVLQEPAIAAYARRTGTRPHWCLDDRLRPLFEGHPDIDVTDDPSGGVTLDASAAFAWATQRGRYFTEGYWHQLGLNEPAEGERVRVSVPGWIPNPSTRPVVMCPFCNCCGSVLGQASNVCPPLDWWEPIIGEFWGQNTILGAADSHRFRQQTAYHFYGERMPFVAGLLKYGRCVLTVETGLLHLASAVTDRIVFLSTATPPTLCVPPGAPWKVVRARTPYDFDAAEVIAAVRSFL